MPTGEPAPDAGRIDGGPLDAGQLDAGRGGPIDAWSSLPQDTGPPPPPCTLLPNCFSCPGGYCVHRECVSDSPTTITYDFETGVPAGWTNTGEPTCSLVGSEEAHGGSASMQLEDCRSGGGSRLGQRKRSHPNYLSVR